MRLSTLLAGLTATALCATVAAQGLQPPGQGGSPPGFPAGDGSVGIGTAPPDLRVEEWATQNKVDALASAQVYAVFFWSTADGSSVRLLPQMAAYADKHPEVEFIAIAQEETAVIRGFMMRLGPGIHYPIASDHRGRTSRTWLRNSQRSEVPTVFLIDATRRIVWIGDPRTEQFPEVLAMVAAGRYNPQLVAAAQPMLEQVRRFVRQREWRQADEYLKQIVDMDSHVFNTIAIERFKVMLVDKGEFRSTYASDPETMRLLARNILTERAWHSKDPEALFGLAHEIASGVYRMTNDARSLSVLALANYRQGNTTEAVTQQRRAFLMADPEDKDEMRAMLDQFQRGAQLQGR